MHLLVGTGASHFHELNLNVENATIEKLSATESPAPGWLVSRDETVYAVAEVDDQPGQLSKFHKDGDNWKLSWRRETSSKGTCHCSLLKAGDKTFVLGANYTGHTVNVLDDNGVKVDTAAFDGSGPFEGRQESSHCHQIVPDLAGKYIYVNDLGGDTQCRYTLADTGKLQAAGTLKFKPAQGPRHCAFNPIHPELVYTICELSNEITIHDWSSETPRLVQSISLLPDASMEGEQHKEYPQPASAGEIQITRDGGLLYASTRYLPKYKSDTILWARLDSDGKMGKVTHHDTGLIAPWHFSLSKDEALVGAAFKDSNVVKIYKRDAKDGSLSDLCSVELESPSCVLFVE
ncbi:protein of unknown function [Taphrina deformans PYCC 5710]|uniref:6-phosphogluconolactonase n=1 Tax=Taphrina deformans (strain PYCC 5710 / ATCC 11124 / CBS 356.35 / IMI 108563 / JCM 9778 / NBRC 8474) TaxID=1097556 RepID=R4XD36_TAPDE|nr:protein of unknown function [Taphrina deformans PYCC 5710]|eukprot:CCG83730.1 protein of unknown function [Taphrina deformans PYCC 5710]